MLIVIDWKKDIRICSASHKHIANQTQYDNAYVGGLRHSPHTLKELIRIVLIVRLWNIMCRMWMKIKRKATEGIDRMMEE